MTRGPRAGAGSRLGAWLRANPSQGQLPPPVTLALAWSKVADSRHSWFFHELFARAKRTGRKGRLLWACRAVVVVTRDAIERAGLLRTDLPDLVLAATERVARGSRGARLESALAPQFLEDAYQEASAALPTWNGVMPWHLQSEQGYGPELQGLVVDVLLMDALKTLALIARTSPLSTVDAANLVNTARWIMVALGEPSEDSLHRFANVLMEALAEA